MFNTDEYMEREENTILNDLETFAAENDVDGFLDYIDHPEAYNSTDINFVLNSRRELIGCQIQLAGGGPTTWADTQNGTLDTTWNGGSISRDLSEEVCEFINDVILEYVFLGGL